MVFRTIRHFGIIVLSAAVPAALMAQTAAAPPPARPNARVYNPATEITVSGTVKEVKEYTGPRGYSGTHLTVQTDHHGTMDVRLGPTSFLSSNNFQLQTGEHVQVIGSQLGNNVLIARELTANGRTLQLRAANGRPLWAGTMANRAAASGMGGMGPCKMMAQSGAGGRMAGMQGMGGGRMGMMGPGRMGPGMTMASSYNPHAELTVTGTVESVREIPGGRGQFGTQVTLKSDKNGTLDVALGPLAYLTANGFQFQPGDQLKVVGSRAGANVLIARQAEANGKTLDLRNASGMPLWMGPNSAARMAPAAKPNAGSTQPAGNR